MFSQVVANDIQDPAASLPCHPIHSMFLHVCSSQAALNGVSEFLALTGQRLAFTLVCHQAAAGRVVQAGQAFRSRCAVQHNRLWALVGRHLWVRPI